MSEISLLSQEFKHLRISKKPKDKKYLISKETRKFLHQNDNRYIGIIPYRSISLPVYNPKKELFLHQTEIMTQENNMICIPLNIQKVKTEKTEVNKIKDWIKKNLHLKINPELIQKILDVEYSRIKIYTVDLTSFSVITKSKPEEELTHKMSKMNLQDSLDLEILKKTNLQLQKITNFYNQIEVRKSVRDLYQNIGSIRQNRTTLQKVLTLGIIDDYKINLKYHLIFNRLS